MRSSSYKGSKMGYYTAVVYISSATLLMLLKLVYDNEQIDEDTRRDFTITFFVVIASMLAEWLGVYLNGAPEWTRVLHIMAKAVDYIASPIIGVRLVDIVLPHSRIQKYLRYLMGTNIIVEILSGFTGWIYYVDEYNHYHHGAYFLFYVIVFSITFLSVLFAYIAYGRRFQKKNRRSISTIIAFIFVGILLQFLYGGDMRTICLTLSDGIILLFIQYLAVALQKNKNDLSEKQMLLDTDVLTGLKSRFAYSNTMDMYNEMDALPQDLVALVFDVNGLKVINDSLGHKAGDELIRGAGTCLKKVFAKYGDCFHVGGDEFIALIRIDPKDCKKLLMDFNDVLAGWKGEIVDKISISVGYAVGSNYPEASIKNLISIADNMMYVNKRRYHKKMLLMNEVEKQKAAMVE